MRKKTSIVLLGFLASALAAATTPARVTLVICAPGYPSNTKEAQPSMDRLATAVTRAIGWPPARLEAEYHETESGGVARFKDGTPTLALVPLPFYLAHARELKLSPRSQAVMKGGQATETWTLVAKKGRVKGASSLAKWQIVGLPGYAPDFIRRVALASWGPLPADVTYAPTGQVLSALRRAAAGDDVAVILDSAQAASLPTLPFAADLETVAVSPPVPAVVLCSVGPTLPPADTRSLVAGLLKMHETTEGAAALDAVRLVRFVPLDEKAVADARAKYESSGAVAAR